MDAESPRLLALRKKVALGGYIFACNLRISFIINFLKFTLWKSVVPSTKSS